MSRPLSQTMDETEGDDPYIKVTQSPSTNNLNVKSDSQPPLHCADSTVVDIQDYPKVSTLLKEAATHIKVNIGEHEKEQGPHKANTTPAYLVMEILDEVLSTLFSTTITSTPSLTPALSTPFSATTLFTSYKADAMSTPCSAATMSTPCSATSMSTPSFDPDMYTPCSSVAMSTPCSADAMSTPCSAAAKESKEDEEATVNQDEVETIEDIQAFVENPVSIQSIGNQPIPIAYKTVAIPKNETKFTPEKDNKEMDHSKVVRKLNMDAKKLKAVMGNDHSQVQKKNGQGKASVKRMSRSLRSGLVFPVSRVAGQMRKGKYARHIRVTAAIYLTAVLEYLVAEVLELSGNCAKYYNKRRVFPRCILLTLRHDAELDQLTKGAIVPQGGVKPFIHRELLPVERQVSHFHPRFGGFLSTQDMLKYNLKPSFPEEDSTVSSEASQT